MSDAFYNEMAQVASDLLTEFGYPESITITRDETSYDPIDGDGEEEFLEGDFIMINPPSTMGKVESFDNRTVGSDLSIDANTRYLIVVAKGAPFVPRQSDKVTLGDKIYNVTGVTPISPGGIDIVYKVGVMA